MLKLVSTIASRISNSGDLYVILVQLALTAGASIFRGLLADVDCRWNVIAQAVDDRTDEEYGKVVCCGLRAG